MYEETIAEKFVNPTLKGDLVLLDSVINVIEKRLKSNLRHRIWKKNHPEKVKSDKKKWNAANPNYHKIKSKKWRESNPDKAKAQAIKWRKNNPEKAKAIDKRWQTAHPEDYRNSLNKSRNKRLQTDPLFKTTHTIRCCITGSLKGKGYTKRSRTYKLLGCSFEEFKAHIEKQFKPGMTWMNHGDWEYDHIIPMASAKNEEEAIKLNYYTNFQPLWKKENREKSDSMPEEL